MITKIIKATDLCLSDLIVIDEKIYDIYLIKRLAGEIDVGLKKKRLFNDYNTPLERKELKFGIENDVVVVDGIIVGS